MRPIPQAELQQDLQRFQGRFTARLAEALAPLDRDPDPAIRRAGMDLQLRLSSAALDIAVGPDSDANLLDMVSLVELAEEVAASHEAGAALAAQGVRLHDTLKKTSDEVWHIARKVLSGTGGAAAAPDHPALEGRKPGPGAGGGRPAVGVRQPHGRRVQYR